MRNEIDEKKKCIKEIKEDLENIEFWRNNYVFEDELELEKIKEIQNQTSKLWLIYYKLYKEKE